MHIKTLQHGADLIAVIIDGNRIDNVADYKITTSAGGTTEVVIKIKFVNECSRIEVSDLLPAPTSSANEQKEGD